ncbi:MAG: hypothetical protein J7K83_03935 [Candidatus Aenigmarchaeota archaeon]|nr:hypothetical protein [Candidatus Aenigmarchaeota archaeon]
MSLDDLENIIKDMGIHTLKLIDVTGGMKGKLMSIKECWRMVALTRFT